MRTTKNRFMAGLLIASLSVGALPVPAQAGLVPTVTMTATEARDRVAVALSRADVRARLEAYGVDRTQVQARVDALTDDEVTQLAGRLDAIPAGGDGIVGAILIVFLVLLITDIVGLTKVFPFTRSIKK